jgi:hypothetical protein
MHMIPCHWGPKGEKIQTMDILRTVTLGCAIVVGATVIAGTLAISFRYQTTITPAELDKTGPAMRQWDRWTGAVTICQGETSEVRLDQPGTLELARRQWEKDENDRLNTELGKAGGEDITVALMMRNVKDRRNGVDRRRAWEDERRKQRAAQGLPPEQEPSPQYETRHFLTCTTFSQPN